MVDFPFPLLALPAMAVVNRFAGMPDTELPGRNLYYATPLAGAASALVFDGMAWWLLWAAAFFVWRLGPWGRWFDLGRLPDGYAREGVEPTLYERAIMAVSPNDHVAFALRHFSGVLPGLAAVAWVLEDYSIAFLAIPFAFAVEGIYELSWRAAEPGENPIGTAELWTGALWGILMLTTALLA